MSLSKHPILPIGTSVLTIKATTFDWIRDASKTRKWGVVGVVQEIHDSHGLCYAVRHADESVGHYDPTELQVLDEQHPRAHLVSTLRPLVMQGRAAEKDLRSIAVGPHAPHCSDQACSCGKAEASEVVGLVGWQPVEGVHRMSRLCVPGGWLYRSTEDSSATFVPDPTQ